MPSLWIWLSLIYALQSSVSSDEGVSLICSKTVEVKAGGTVTLNCTIEWHEEKSRVDQIVWMANDKIICPGGSADYICTSDYETYVSLTITNVMKEEDITVEIRSFQGMDDSSIKVKLAGMSPIYNNTVKVKAGDDMTLNSTNQNGEINSSHPEENQELRKTDIQLALSVILGVFATAIVVVAMMYVLFRIDQRRKSIKPANDLSRLNASKTELLDFRW